MIKLDRPKKPKELTEQVQALLTAIFKDSGKSVWSKDYIKIALLKMSSNKCAFCEMKLGEESKYLEVEHFHHKNLYKDEVVDWDNLLPSCRKCNGTKGKYDTKEEPIINPCIADPKKHLKLSMNYRLKGIDDLGKNSIIVLNLNDQDRLVTPRFKIGNAIIEKIEDNIELIDDVISGVQTGNKRKNKIKNNIEALLTIGLKDKAYSATCSTVIISSEEFHELKNKMISTDLWEKRHSDLEHELNQYMLI